MGRSKTDITLANREFYFHNYGKRITRAGKVFKIILLMYMVFLIIFLIAGCQKTVCFYRASREMLDIEVSDWVQEQSGSFWFNWMTAVTGLYGGIVGVWAWYWWKRVKSYNLYRKKKKIVLVPVLFSIVETIAIIVGISGQAAYFLLWLIIVVGMLAIDFPLLMGARLFVPWELTPLIISAEQIAVFKSVFYYVIDVVAKWFFKGM